MKTYIIIYLVFDLIKHKLITIREKIMPACAGKTPSWICISN